MRTRFNKPSTLRLRSPDLIPDRMFVKLRYTDIIVRTVPSAVDNYVFRGNSCFDPDFTGTGHQPFGFDQWAAANSFYNRYRVHASKMVIRFINEGLVGMAAAIYPSIVNTLPSTWSNASEVPRSRTIIIGQNTGADARLLKTVFMSTKKMFGMRSINQDDLFQAVYSSSPNRQWYWVLTTSSTDLSTFLTYSISFTMHFYVEFFDRQQIGQS